MSVNMIHNNRCMRRRGGVNGLFNLEGLLQTQVHVCVKPWLANLIHASRTRKYLSSSSPSAINPWNALPCQNFEALDWIFDKSGWDAIMMCMYGIHPFPLDIICPTCIVPDGGTQGMKPRAQRQCNVRRPFGSFWNQSCMRWANSRQSSSAREDWWLFCWSPNWQPRAVMTSWRAAMHAQNRSISHRSLATPAFRSGSFLFVCLFVLIFSSGVCFLGPAAMAGVHCQVKSVHFFFIWENVMTILLPKWTVKLCPHCINERYLKLNCKQRRWTSFRNNKIGLHIWKSARYCRIN